MPVPGAFLYKKYKHKWRATQNDIPTPLLREVQAQMRGQYYKTQILDDRRFDAVQPVRSPVRLLDLAVGHEPGGGLRGEHDPDEGDEGDSDACVCEDVPWHEGTK